MKRMPRCPFLAIPGAAFAVLALFPQPVSGQLAPPLPIEPSGDSEIATNPANPFAPGAAGMFPLFIPDFLPTVPAGRPPGAEAAEEGQTGLRGFGFGVEFGTFNIEDTDVDRWVIPLSYHRDFDNFAGTLEIDAPLSYAQIDGDDVLSGSLGLGVRYPLFDGLLQTTPELRIGAVSSNGASTGTFVYGGSWSNEVFLAGDDLGTIPLLSHLTIHIGNTISHFRVEDVRLLQDDGLKYSHRQTIIRNGIALTHPFSAFGQDLAGTVFVTDTRFVGEDIVVDQYNEFGVVFRWEEPLVPGLEQPINIGVTYSRSNEGSGVRANFGYRF